MFFRTACLLTFISTALAVNIVLTNDDGWAVGHIRATNTALIAAGHNVILSAPAENESGTGSSSATPTPLTQACEFNTCPKGSPAEGSNATSPQINYVNSFPVDSVRYGIQTLSPKFFGGAPVLVVSGPNVGNNLGSTVQVSGTVGAASEAALEGIPSIAFSGDTGSQVSYTTLQSSPNSASSTASNIYASLNVKFTNALLAPASRPILPAGISLNVNYPATTGSCTSASKFKFVLSRILANSKATDVETCGTDHLPTETSVVDTKGCFASVSVFNASTKADVDAATQQFVLTRLGSLLTCL